MARFVRNPVFHREIEATPLFERSMGAEASKVARHVRAVAPKRTRYYVNRVRSPGARVTLGDFAWHWIEYGSVNNPAYAPVRKGVRAAGLRFRDSRSYG